MVAGVCTRNVVARVRTGSLLTLCLDDWSGHLARADEGTSAHATLSPLWKQWLVFLHEHIIFNQRDASAYTQFRTLYRIARPWPRILYGSHTPESAILQHEYSVRGQRFPSPPPHLLGGNTELYALL